jgi:hypothetical protein
MMRLRQGLMIVVLMVSLGVMTAQADDPVLHGVGEAVIAAYPEPDVTPLTVNEERMYDRWYLQTLSRLDVFDAPNGAVVGALEDGFNFVTGMEQQDGWVHINPGEWVRADQLRDSSGVVSSFTGVLLPEEALPYPMAWALVNLYAATEPGGEPSESNPLIYRYTRLNLYDTVEIAGERWYQVGVNQWVIQYHVGKVIPMARPEGVTTDLWMALDLYEQVMTVYRGEQPIFATLIATGLDRWPTREGIYPIYFRKERDNMTGGQVGDDFYFLEEVPWTMFFDEGRALHGAYWHDGFGFRRSHGCVNLSLTDAHWLYALVADEMGSWRSADREAGPQVYIHSSGIYQ